MYRGNTWLQRSMLHRGPQQNYHHTTGTNPKIIQHCPQHWRQLSTQLPINVSGLLQQMLSNLNRQDYFWRYELSLNSFRVCRRNQLSLHCYCRFRKTLHWKVRHQDWPQQKPNFKILRSNPYWATHYQRSAFLLGIHRRFWCLMRKFFLRGFHCLYMICLIYFL